MNNNIYIVFLSLFFFSLSTRRTRTRTRTRRRNGTRVIRLSFTQVTLRGEGETKDCREREGGRQRGKQANGGRGEEGGGGGGGREG